MNLAGLEQLHKGKGDDEANRSPLQASQSQVHRAEGSADDRIAQGLALKSNQGRSRWKCFRNWD